MSCHYCGHEVYDSRTEPHHEEAKDEKTDYAADKNGEHEQRRSHLEHPGREQEQLEGCGRWEHCRDHHGEELLVLEAISQSFKSPPIDVLQKQQLSSRSSNSVWNQTSQCRSNCCHEDVEPYLHGMCVDISGNNWIKWNADCA